MQMVILLTQVLYGMVDVFPTWHIGKCVVMCDAYRYIYIYRASEYIGCFTTSISCLCIDILLHNHRNVKVWFCAS